MGCGGSKHGMVAVGGTVNYRRFARRRSAVSRSKFKSYSASAYVADGIGAPATTNAAAAGDSSPDRRFARGKEEEGRRAGTCPDDNPAAPLGVHKPEGEITIRRVPSKLHDVDVSRHEPEEHEESPPAQQKVANDTQWQLQQVTEKLARLSPEDDVDSEEDAAGGGRTHEQETANGPKGKDETYIQESLFGQEDKDEDDQQFGNAPEELGELDFSNKDPVYDEDPYDLPAVPSLGAELSAEENDLPSPVEELRDDQNHQILPATLQNCGCRRFSAARRSRMYGDQRKRKKTHHQLRHRQIRKRTKRRAYRLFPATRRTYVQK